MKSLIIYSTTDGHTKKICEFINSNSIKNSFEILSFNSILNLNLEKYNLIVIAASIRYGKHKPEVLEFVNKNLQILNKKKSVFFSVNVVARKPEKNTPETNPYIKKFLKTSNWKPKKIGVFAGRVDYPNYGFFDKYVIKLIMFLTNGPTDTSQSYEFTDWSKVDNFARELDKNS